MRWGMAAGLAPVRSIWAIAAGAWLIQMASRLSLTSSLVRPVLTLCGWSSASQPVDAGVVALVDEQPLLARRRPRTRAAGCCPADGWSGRS